MKHFYCILLGVILTTQLYSQSKVISGRLVDADGSPMPGVNILIKGTTTGTVTDVDGKYSISAPIGATLVFSFIGFETREVVVGEDDSTLISSTKKKTKNRIVPFPAELLNDSLKNSVGIGVFDYTSKSYRSQVKPSILKINKVKEFGSKFIIKSVDDPYVRKGYGLQYAQLVGLSHITQLPKIQSTYAQGRSTSGSTQWFGPDMNEIFSWGPRINNLEYDGLQYPYDRYGQLVPLGNGSGKQANKYNNKDFYRTGFLSRYSVQYSKSISRNGNMIAGLDYINQNSVIPNSGKNNLTANINLKDINLTTNSRITFSGLYADSKGYLLNHGANNARIFGDFISTPLTFDNSNGLQKKEAIRNSASYEISPGNIRSYAPQFANNPYGLAATSPDTDHYRLVFSSLKYEWKNTYKDRNELKLDINGSYDFQNISTRYGIPYGYVGSIAGILTNRVDKKESVDLRITPSYSLSDSDGLTDWKLTLLMDYKLTYANRSLFRDDGFGFVNNINLELEKADSIAHFNTSIDRISHQFTTSAKLVLDRLYTFHIGNTIYSSSTLTDRSFINFFPFIGLKAKVEAYPFELTPKISYSRSIQESSLVYNDWAYVSNNSNSGDFRNVYEFGELVFNNTVAPEFVSRFEFDVNSWLDRFLMKVNYKYEIIDDFIVPVYSVDHYLLKNVAKISNESYKVSLEYHGYSYWPINYSLGLKWSKNLPNVITLYDQNNFVPLSGFSNASSVLAEGEPLGTIYGTYYERNSSGALIIDNDGYPISTGNVKALGNTNPNWTMGFDGYLEWRNLSFDLLIEYLYGGNVWNGTAAYLDYLGLSTNSEEQRSVTDFIYKGVDQNGNINTISVNFYDASQDISQNRWVRYGPGGVAEDFIENATSFRISEVKLKYLIPFRRNSGIHELSVILSGFNLLQITPYSGVDPQTLLFGNTLGMGLDMFNMPSIRSYQLKLMIKL